MTNLESTSGDDRAAFPSWVLWIAIGLVVAGVALYTFIPRGGEATWGQRGDAIGPFGALFNAAAFFAALWAIRLQSEELRLQRQELRETRGEMAEQRKQFERTAKAQEQLAESQKQLAQAQEEANQLALTAAVAQQRDILVKLVVAEADINTRAADLNARSGNMGDAFRQQMKSTLERIARMKRSHKNAIRALAEVSDFWKDDDDA